MTSLFFVMLILFVLVYTMQNRMIGELKAKEAKLERIDEIEKISAIQNKMIGELKIKVAEFERIKDIEKTVNNIDPNYFSYDRENKKHILNVQFLYPTGSKDISKIVPDKRTELLNAGKAIRNLILKYPEKENIKYLIVIEGQASKDNWSGNDDLSFHRAQSLQKFWNQNGIGLDKLRNCEIVIAGSGEKGIPRTQPDVKPANQRFLITIVPKIGQINKNSLGF